MDFTSVTVAGPGLLGGSVLLALRERWPAVKLRAWCRRAEAAEELRARFPGIEAGTDLAASVDGADLLVLGMPIRGMAPAVAGLVGVSRPGLIITDVGSVKGSVVREVAPHAEAIGAVFVGSHPMAGSDKTGLENATPGLFQGSLCYLTPAADTPGLAVARVAAFWEGLGAATCVTDPGTHDQAVARISHLPHSVSALLARTALAGQEKGSLAVRGAAGGARDTTRIAGSAPGMWVEILLENRTALLPLLREFHEHTAELLAWLEQGDEESVRRFLELARASRRLLE